MQYANPFELDEEDDAAVGALEQQAAVENPPVSPEEFSGAAASPEAAGAASDAAIPGQTPGRMDEAGQPGLGQKIGGYFGFNQTGMSDNNKQYQEQTGINPRMAYWGAALSDLGQVMDGRANPNSAASLQQHQAQVVQQAENQKKLDAHRKQQTYISMLNATKAKSETQTSAMKDAKSMGLEPGTDEWNKYIMDRTKKVPLVSMPDKAMGAMMGKFPDMHTSATMAAQDVARWDAMEAVMGNAGQMGKGKVFMTNMRSSLTQFGMEGSADVLDILGEEVGVDFFDGEQGAAELYKALSDEATLARIKELKPASDKDVSFLQNLLPGLTTASDSRAQMVLLNSQREKSRMALDQYNTIRGMPMMIEAGWPAIEVPEWNLRGLDGPQGEQTTDKVKAAYDQYGIDM